MADQNEQQIGLRPPEPWPVRYPHPLSEATGLAILEEVRAIRALLKYGSPSWVTNGILAVRRDRIANEALFAPRVAELALGAEGFKDKDDAYFERLIAGAVFDVGQPIGKERS